MRNDRKQATELRRAGRSYKEIGELLGVSKGTLSFWFKDKKWSQRTEAENRERAVKISRQRIMRMNAAREKKLALYYENARIEAQSEFMHNHSTPNFIAGLMLYLGEGDKSLANNSVHIANTDPSVLRIFTHFLIEYCAVPKEKIHVWILGYPDINVENCETWWSRELSIPRAQFYKSQIIQGRHKTRKLHFGVGNITIGNKRIKVKVLRWIELSCRKLEQNAGMV